MGATMLRNKVREYVKASCGSPMCRVIVRACSSGHLDVVRWLVSVLGIERNEAQWTLFGEPLFAAIGEGRMEVVRWMFAEFRFAQLPVSALLEMVDLCADGAAPGNLKWCEEIIPPGVINKNECQYLMFRNEHSTVEDCRWLEDDIIKSGVEDYIFEKIKKPDIAKWVLSTFPIAPAAESLNCLCKTFGDIAFAEWLATEKHFTLSADTFVAACSTSKGGASLARWLSTRVTLTQADLLNGLKEAIRWSNIDVADWLEETFHVMSLVNSVPDTAGSFLMACTEDADPKDRVEGIKWLIHHLSEPSSIGVDSILSSISEALRCFRRHTVSYLLETFPAFEPQNLFKNLVIEFMEEDLGTLKRILLPVGPSLLSGESTAEFVGKCLTSKDFQPYSSKIVKWNRCVQWVLDSFDIPLCDVFEMADKWFAQDRHVDLSTWLVILRKYPTIDAGVIRQHFLPIAASSPHIGVHAMRECGLPAKDLLDYLGTELDDLPLDLKLWRYFFQAPNGVQDT